MENIQVEPKKETYKTKFKVLAVIALVQSIMLWYIIYNHYTYNLSLLENILVAIIFVTFYSLIFAKKQVKSLVDKAFEW